MCEMTEETALTISDDLIYGKEKCIMGIRKFQLNGPGVTVSQSKRSKPHAYKCEDKDVEDTDGFS